MFQSSRRNLIKWWLLTDANGDEKSNLLIFGWSMNMSKRERWWRNNNICTILSTSRSWEISLFKFTIKGVEIDTNKARVLSVNNKNLHHNFQLFISSVLFTEPLLLPFYDLSIHVNNIRADMLSFPIKDWVIKNCAISITAWINEMCRLMMRFSRFHQRSCNNDNANVETIQLWSESPVYSM